METYFKKIVYPHLSHKICFMGTPANISGIDDIVIYCETCSKVIYDEKIHFHEAIEYYENITDKMTYGENF